MACLIQNSSSTAAQLPVHENLSKKRKLISPGHFKNKRVQRIHDTTTSPPWTPLDSPLKLEQEAIQYFYRFYCKDCQMDQQAAEHTKAATSAAACDEDQLISSDTGGLMSFSDLKQEPALPMSPQQTTDEASLMGTLDKNKESLKRKLMMRRSLSELVDQGIYPSPKTPQAFMEQRKNLERAKIGDTLRFKIRHRPDRQQLIQQHILEDTNIDPSLHDRQRQLKKARLADSLNDKLSHRPGVLELVQGNIIQTEGKLHQLIKEGSLSFDKANGLDIGEDVAYGFDDSRSSDDTPNEHTDDSNQSVISSPPVTCISVMPELPTKSLTFPAQIQFQQDLKVTVPLPIQQFSIPLQTAGSGSFTFCATSGSFVSSRNNVTVSTINNNFNNKSRPKKPKPKPQPKTKIIKFHEYKGPPNIIKCSPVVSSAACVNVTANSIAAQQHHHQQLQQQQQSDTSYHILLQQQQLFLQWQLEFGQKNLNATTLLVTPTKETQPGSHAITSSVESMITGSCSMSNIIASAAEAANVTMTTPTTSQMMFTMTKISHHAQPATQVKQICSSSPVVTPMKQEPQVGQPLPQMYPNITPITTKPPVRKPTVNINNGTVKLYSSLEEMKVAELKAELKQRNLTVSGPKPQLIERLKPYADAIIKSPSGSVTSPTSLVSSSMSLATSRACTSPQPFSVLSPMTSVPSPDTIVIPSKTVFISSTGSVMSSSASDTKMSLPVVFPTFSCVLSQPSYVQSQFVSKKSPSSSAGSITSPASTAHAGSVFSRPGSVMSPLGSVIDETLCSNVESPLPSIQSMQSAVNVSNMALISDDLSNPFSPPSSPFYMDNILTPPSPDIMDTCVTSPKDFMNGSSSNMYQLQTINIGHAEQNQISDAGTNVEQARHSLVMSAVHSDVDKANLEMDVDLDLNTSLSTEIVPPHVSIAVGAPVTSLPFAEASLPPGLIQQQHDDQYQILRHIQIQLALLQERQKQQQKQQQTAATSYQLSQEELLKQQQEKIEKLQVQLEESQLRLQLQQFQQQQQLQQLQQQQVQQQVAHQQMVQQYEASPEFQVSVSPSSASPQQAMQTQSRPLQIVKTDPHPHQPTQMQTQGVVHAQSCMLAPPKVIIKMQPQTPISKNSHIRQHAVSIIQTQPLQSKKSQKVLEQFAHNQKPATTVQPVIFGVPNLPNGSKATTLANLPTHMKQIQIPAHLMHAFQTVQGVPAVIVTQNPKASTTKAKPPSLEFFRNQAINQSLTLGGGKSLIAVSTCSGGTAVTTSSSTTHQFIITTAPVTVKSSTAPHISSISSNFNGLSQPAAQKMHSSLPASPVEGNNQPLARRSSNPFFIPMKEPPKYDDAVRTKHSKKTGSGVPKDIEKSQTMDDVLEILIRSGELPPSAAGEPPPTPNTATQSPSTTIPAISVSQSNMMSLPHNDQPNPSVVFSLLANQIPLNSHSEDIKETIDSNFTDFEMMVARTSSHFVNKSEPYSEVKLEFDCNIMPKAVDSVGFTNSNKNNANSEELIDFNDVMNCDLSAMDWTPDPVFADLELTDTSGINTTMDLMRNDQSLPNITTVNSPQRSMHGSEPDLANLGLADMETNYNTPLDVPDWLDVIMPSMGFTFFNANTPMSFPADPILTPQTQREMLDLFSFDESDLPLDFTCGNSWDKLTGTTSS